MSCLPIELQLAMSQHLHRHRMMWVHKELTLQVDVAPAGIMDILKKPDKTSWTWYRTTDRQRKVHPACSGGWLNGRVRHVMACCRLILSHNNSYFRWNNASYCLAGSVVKYQERPDFELLYNDILVVASRVTTQTLLPYQTAV